MKGENYWKKLAISRRLVIKAIKARLVEVIEGREKWKKKAMQYNKENIILKKQLGEIKKNFNR